MIPSSYLTASACSLPPEAKTGRRMSVYRHAAWTLMLISLITSRGLIKVIGKCLTYLSVAEQVHHIHSIHIRSLTSRANRQFQINKQFFFC